MILLPKEAERPLSAGFPLSREAERPLSAGFPLSTPLREA